MRFKRTGFTLGEILIVIVIIAILAAILFPIFVRAKARMQKNTCLVNMKNIGKTVLLYVQDYDGCLPRDSRDIVWMKSFDRRHPLAVGPIKCPTFNLQSDITKGTGYGFSLGITICPKKGTKDRAYFWDGQDLTDQFTPPSAGWWMPTWLDYRHQDSANIGFLDGHVKSYSRPDPAKPDNAIPTSIF